MPRALIALVLIILLSGCEPLPVTPDAPAAPTSPPAQEATAADPTALPAQPTAPQQQAPAKETQPTAVAPPTEAPPTEAPPAQAPPTLAPPTQQPPTAEMPPAPAEPQTIAFAPGATSAALSADLPANGTAHYTLQAMQGQLMEVTLSTPSDATRLTIRTQDGATLLSETGSLVVYRDTLPATQEYTIVVTAGPSATPFALEVIIPERIQFAPGATVGSDTATLEAFGQHHYVLHIAGGQYIDVRAEADAATQLGLYGEDGTVLQSAADGSPIFQGNVPTTQDYVVTVLGGPVGTEYTFRAVIPERIAFAAGTTMATLNGELDANAVQHYILRADAGQTLSISLAMPAGSVRMDIRGLDGVTLARGMGATTRFSAPVPTSQDYVITLTASDEPARYVMQVSVVG
jgi:hypothetical protein